MYVLYDISFWDIANRATWAFIDFEFVTDLIEIGMGGGLDRSMYVRKLTRGFCGAAYHNQRIGVLKVGPQKIRLFSPLIALIDFSTEECAKILASVPYFYSGNSDYRCCGYYRWNSVDSRILKGQHQ